MRIKSLKEIRMPMNCGLSALEQIAELKNVSAFTLVHLGRDNGLNLFVFKVENLADLPRVVRPAIFHQKDHFVHIKNGEAMPDGEYTGYVIGPAVLGRVIGLSEAKFIKGGKNFFTGKNSDGEQTGSGAIGDILAVVAAVATTIVTGGNVAAGAAAGGAVKSSYGAVERAQNQDELGKPGDIGLIGKDLVVGGLEGYGAGSIASGIGAAGSASGSSALSSNAANQAAFNAARAGSGTTFTAGAQGAGLSGQVGAFNAAQAGNIAAGANLTNATKAFGGGTANPTGATGANASNLATSGTTFNAAPGVTTGANAVTPSTFQNVVSGTQNAARKIGTDVSNINSTIGKATNGIVGGNSPIGAGQLATGALSILNPPPQPQGSSTENYSAARQFLGDQGYAALKTPTQNTLLNYVNTPIADLQTQFTANNQRTLDKINSAYDNQKNQLVHQFAQAGQNMANSSDLQNRVSELEQKRVNDITLAQQELTDQALTHAINVKQDALSKALQQGQYDSNLAMDLAKITGQDQALQYSIERGNYEDFQNIMANLLAQGLKPQPTN